MYLGGGRPRHEDTVETLFPVIFLGRAAENNVGPGGRVHDMRTMWSPYNQSCNLGGPAGKKVGPEDRVLDMRDMWSSYDQSCKQGGAARKNAPHFPHVVDTILWPNFFTGGFAQIR